jgi:hypothetical protein
MTLQVDSRKELAMQRPYQQTDVHFIYATWLRGLYYGNDWFREIDQDIYFNAYSKSIENILSRTHVKIDVSCLKDDQDVVLGYVVYEKHVMHWIFVKQPWRKFGIAKDLLPKDIQIVTHLTKVGKSLKPQNWIFNPFLI